MSKVEQVRGAPRLRCRQRGDVGVGELVGESGVSAGFSCYEFAQLERGLGGHGLVALGWFKLVVVPEVREHGREMGRHFLGSVVRSGRADVDRMPGSGAPGTADLLVREPDELCGWLREGRAGTAGTKRQVHGCAEFWQVIRR